MPKPPLQLKDPEAEQPAVSDTKRPKAPPANSLPTEGYSIEVDGTLKTHYASADEASKAGLELKKKYPSIQVNVYDAKARSRALVTLSD